MELTRRDFLKFSGGGAAGIALFSFLDPDSLLEAAPMDIPLRKEEVGERTTICPYCGVGCSLLVAAVNGKATNVEGDPDHPINQGTLCSKGAALIQVTDNPRRLSRVLYRAPGAYEWEEKTWDWAIERIARNIKRTRDDNWTHIDDKGRVVNRTEAIANDGSAVVNNEEAYLITKLCRSLGLTYIEHCARLCHSSTVSALGASFGRGAMTNHWIDLKNADCIMIIGSNAAENHPISFKWITKAMKEKGAKLISVDPRFTRTSAQADIYARMRSGTDVAFIGGMIKYVVEDIERNPDNYNMTYIGQYTNASLLVDPGFEGAADLDGLFSGYNPDKREYDRSTWIYQMDEKGIPLRDPSLKDPNCVFQILKKHFNRYDIDTVCSITGTPRDVYIEVIKTYTATGKSGKAATIIYAMGTTQHTNAVQMIRSYAILQLLLGNIGVAGGGINAARGQSNVQGSTDHAILYHILPGYLKTPSPDDLNLETYLKNHTPTSNNPESANWWQNYRKYMVSMLKAWYGNAASSPEFAYEYLPKVEGDHSHIAITQAMHKGIIKGLISWGHNTAVSGPNGNMERADLDKLDWLLVSELWESETAAFWKRPGVDPGKINTEVFLLPARASLEKEGSITNSGRWSQWRYTCCNAPEMAQTDLWIFTRIVEKLKELYYEEGGAYPDPILNMTWDYGHEPDVHQVAREINGYDLTTGKLLSSFVNLQSDGSTSAGNWLYCGSYTEDGNMAARRDLSQTISQANIALFPNWSWSWPVNRRILYNRASVDLDGNPWNPEAAVIAWNSIFSMWDGDVPDGGWPPMTYEGTRLPFIMTAEGRGCIFAPGKALKDGPLPEHYEPWESPVQNIMSGTQNDPAITIWKSDMDFKGEADKFPIVCTTFRLSEHWQAGQMTRNLPWLVELMPEMFVEVGEELALEKGIVNGGKITVESARGKIQAVAMVTKRFTPFKIGGKKVHEIGMPWHWGYMGLSTGDSANLLTANIGDANTTIPEYKAFLCNVFPG